MNDKELLVMAAKAAGLEIAGPVEWYVPQHGHYDGGFVVGNDKGGDSLWNPLTDDADALRLAVKLGISIIQSGATRVCESADGTYLSDEVDSEGDGLAATRRAIVRAAAEIGKAMP